MVGMQTIRHHALDDICGVDVAGAAVNVMQHAILVRQILHSTHLHDEGLCTRL